MSLSAATSGPSTSPFLSNIGRFGLLSRERERVLSTRIIRDRCQQSIDELVTSNLRFVVKLAGEYRSFGLPFEDLVNEGIVGLIEAAKRFDARRGTKFVTYAHWWIRKAILKALSDQGTVRMPISHMRKLREIRRAEEQLRGDLGREPGREEVAGLLDEDPAQVDRDLACDVQKFSLEECNNRDRPILETLEDTGLSTAPDQIMRREELSALLDAVDRLPERHAQVIRLRFGIPGGRGLTLREVGKRLSLCRERVRQIECQAKARLRKMLIIDHEQPATS